MAVVGIDVGGTFTDIVTWDGTSISAAKVATPLDPADAVNAAVEPHHQRLVHGTTVATNALLERRGANTVLVTTPGFEDVLEIGRQDRPSLYDGDADRALPLVARSARFAAEHLEEVVAMDPAAVAVALIDAHLDPSAEQAIGTELRRRLPAAAISLSSAVSPEMREFERTSTTVLNAYLEPVVGGYLRSLSDQLSVSIMRSSGGLLSADRAAQLPAAILLSGPAGGAVAAGALANAMGRERVIAFDMGGTSTDVSRIEGGRPEVAYERSVDGYIIRVPSVAIHTVGAGGGSIGWRDSGGALRVGPRSAGAHPGPACYGTGGTAPTVTDANAALGRLPSRLGGHLELDIAAASTALAGLGFESPVEAAFGMVAVVEENMAQAIRRVSIEEGVDPSDATLVAFGGAGGLHATALARGLGMSSVLVPPLPGVFSAVGLLLSPSRADAVVAVSPDADLASVRAAAATASARAAAELLAMTGSSASVSVFADLRYRGQSHELTVGMDVDGPWDEVLGAFHALHLERNGFALADDPVEVIAVRAEATAPPTATLADFALVPEDGPAERGEIQLIENGSPIDAALWWRPSLRHEVVGPAIIAEPSCTTLVATGERAIVRGNGALELEW